MILNTSARSSAPTSAIVVLIFILASGSRIASSLQPCQPNHQCQPTSQHLNHQTQQQQQPQQPQQPQATTGTKLDSDETFAILLRAVQRQQQLQHQQQQQHQLEQGQQQQQQRLATNANVTQLLFHRFYHLFKDAPDAVKQAYLPPPAPSPDWVGLVAAAASNLTGGSDPSGEQSRLLETRRLTTGAATAGDSTKAKDDDDESGAKQRNYFRIVNRVFSRVELPEVYRARGRVTGGHCGQHIGCVEEIPNFPSLLKKSNVSSSFTLYTRETPRGGLKILYEPTIHHQLQDANQSEIELHEKLKSSLGAQVAAQAAAAAAAAVAAVAAAAANTNRSSPATGAAVSPAGSPIRQVVSLAAAGAMAAAAQAKPLQHLQHLGHLGQHLQQHHHHHHHLATASSSRRQSAASSLLGGAASLRNHHHSHHQHPPPSWQSLAKIAHTQEYPFDLAALEASGFNASQNTRIIVGGYFAKEDEEWIDEVVRQWQLLEPAGNIIKVSWADANRGLYHTAAYNSRIVARQLTLFLFYLDQLFSIDLDKFHLVGHSLGAHIAGFVGADNEGRIARITGLDPAGPIFVELNASMRLDPGDAKFVDVVHTNGGSITKGALGLHTPSGHVDYYCNGGSIQPGCYFSSVTRSIMDPVERVACSHRRSYRYFIEITKLAISEQQQQHQNQDLVAERQLLDLASSNKSSSQLPRAFLFEAKNDELMRLVQPEITLMSNSLSRRGELTSNGDQLAPLKRRLEFHLLKPDFPPGKRGLYFFKTRSESPFFATKQYALVIRTETVIKRKIALLAKFDHQLVVEAELDEIPGVYTLAFAPNDPRVLELSDLGGGGDMNKRVPQLQLMWKHRSFNLLLSQAQNELHLSGLEVSLIDSDSDELAVIRYTAATVNGGASSQPSSSSSLSSSSSSASVSSSSSPASILTTTPSSVWSLGGPKGSAGGGLDLALARNQWYKFEGRLERW